jgi:hypothetical protein
MCPVEPPIIHIQTEKEKPKKVLKVGELSGHRRGTEMLEHFA